MGPAKYFRPLTLLSCYRATFTGAPPRNVMRSALAVELLHNVSLIADDIVDHSTRRRGRQTLHCRYGALTAWMTAGYLTAGAFALVAGDPYAVRLLAALLQRLGAAECRQWRSRRHPLGLAFWRALAAEDTGSMFEVCACLGARNVRLRHFGSLLGILYHGCDDVADVRGAAALGGGGRADLRDGILTLPAALATETPKVAESFRAGRRSTAALEFLRRRFVRILPRAEQYLDQLARLAVDEARRRGRRPDGLVYLVRHTRLLSQG
jgi:geranylgeranyl pyrophosphate synthase